MLNYLKYLFNSGDHLVNIKKIISDHGNLVTKLKTEIELGESLRDQYNKTLFDICGYLKLYIWKKNKDHVYEFVNNHYCSNFFGLEPEQAKDILGFSDREIRDMYTAGSDEDSFWVKACLMTDTIVSKQTYPINFIEGDLNHNILNVKKIPILEEGEYRGVIGIAQDCDKDQIIPYLKVLIEQKKVKYIHGSLDSTFCYQILEDKNTSLFSFIIP